MSLNINQIKLLISAYRLLSFEEHCYRHSLSKKKIPAHIIDTTNIQRVKEKYIELEIIRINSGKEEDVEFLRSYNFKFCSCAFRFLKEIGVLADAVVDIAFRRRLDKQEREEAVKLMKSYINNPGNFKEYK